MPNFNKKNSRRTSPFRFATGLFALTLLTQLFHGFNISYYVDYTGIVSIYLASICKIIFVIVDGLNDIFFGALSEKTKSKWGKRLPWLVGGLPVLPLFILLAYVIDKSAGFSQTGFFIYYLFISIMIENASTVMYINYGALYPVLFVTDKERAECSSLRHLFEMIAMGICYVCTPLLMEVLHSYFLIGLIYTAVYFVVMIFCITGLKTKGKEDIILKKPYSFIQTLKDVLHNRPFLIYNLAQSFFQAILGLIVSIYPMYCKYVLHTNSATLAALMAVLFGSLVLSIPFWIKYIEKHGFRMVWKICFTALPIALFFLVLPINWWQGCIVMIFIGPFVGGLMLSPDMMSAELIDIDKMKYKISREASFNSIGSLISRVSLIVSAIAMSALSFAFGYESGSNPGPNPELAFRAMCGVMFPIICACGTLFCYKYIKISNKDSQDLKAYKAMLEEKENSDNITD